MIHQGITKTGSVIYGELKTIDGKHYIKRTGIHEPYKQVNNIREVANTYLGNMICVSDFVKVERGMIHRSGIIFLDEFKKLFLKTSDSLIKLDGFNIVYHKTALIAATYSNSSA